MPHRPDARRPKPSRDPSSTKYPDRTFYSGQWRTPEAIETIKKQERANYRRQHPPKPRRGHIDRDGYRVVSVPGHPMATSYGAAYVHRLVMSMVIGRVLKPEERVHHMDENKLFNAPWNLWVFADHASHSAWHSMQKYGHELRVFMPAVELPALPVPLTLEV